MIDPSPELIAGSTFTGDCDRVRAVVGDHDTVWGALEMVKVTNVDVTEYEISAGAVAAKTQVPGAVKEMTADNALTVQPVAAAVLTE